MRLNPLVTPLEAAPTGETRPHVARPVASARTRLVLCLLFGVLTGFATAPTDLVPLAWLGLAGFAWALGGPGVPRVGRQALLGLAFGVGANLVIMQFMIPVVMRFTPFPLPVALLAEGLLALLEGLRFAIAGAVYAVFRRWRVPAPLALACGVFLGTLLPTMLPWTVALMGVPWLESDQLAAIVGGRGLAALVTLEAALGMTALQALARRRLSRGALLLALGAGLMGLRLGYGHFHVGRIEAARARAPKTAVALVTPGFTYSQDVQQVAVSEAASHANLRKLRAYTREAERLGAELVVWPEAAYPFFLLRNGKAPKGEFAMRSSGTGVPILTGFVSLVSTHSIHNSAAVFPPGASFGPIYDKMHLMWFGEWVPLVDVWPWLREMTGIARYYLPGRRQTVLESGPARIGALICLEDILPVAAREASARNPNLLVNLTNDSWFVGTAESELHLRLAQLRAIETGRDMVRAANQGQTAWIHATGRVAARRPGDRPGILLARPALLEGQTFYARWGDWPGLALIALLLAGFGLRRASARQRPAESAGG